MDVGNLISAISSLSNFSLYIWRFSVHILCWSLAWRILSITLLACEVRAVVWYFEHSLTLPFFVIEMKTNLFQSCGHCWVFQVCWHIECSTLTASSFGILNSSAGILSSPLLFFFFFVVKLPKARFTLQEVWLWMSDHTIVVIQVIKSFLEVKEMQEILVWFLGQEDLLVEECQPFPVFLPWKPHG